MKAKKIKKLRKKLAKIRACREYKILRATTNGQKFVRNPITIAAIEELEGGGGKSFNSIEELMHDLQPKARWTLIDEPLVTWPRPNLTKGIL